MLHTYCIDRNIPYAVYAKPRRSQFNVRQNLSATDRNFGFTCHNER